jgi:GTP-binding protein
LKGVRSELSFASYAPLLTGSALVGFDTASLYRTIREVDAGRNLRVGTGELNRFLQDALMRRSFRVGKKELRLLYAVQTGVAPPTFQLFVNLSQKPPPLLSRFIENRLRESFNFVGTPIRIAFRLRAAKERKK